MQQFAPQPAQPYQNGGQMMAPTQFTPPPAAQVQVAPQGPVQPAKPRGRPRATAQPQAPQQAAVVLDGGGHGVAQAMPLPQPQFAQPAPAGGAPAWTPPAQQGMPPAGPPAFLQPQGPTAPPAQQFGMQANPPAPNPEMMAALDAAISFGQKPNG